MKLQLITANQVTPQILAIPAQIFANASLQSVTTHLKNGQHFYYLIVDDANNFLGIVGFSNPTQTIVDLMFSGLVPQHRKKGHFPKAIQLVEVIIKAQFPQATHIREVAPEDKKTYFQSIGFTLTKQSPGRVELIKKI